MGLSNRANSQVVLGGVDMGNLPNYFMFFSDGSTDANWQGATKGFVGDIVIDGIQAHERTSGSVPYGGTIYTNDNTLGAWQAIVNANSGQAFSSLNNTTLVSDLTDDLESAFSQINALAVTAGYNGVSPTSLNGLNTQNGIAETYVINITSGFQVSTKINITGDANDFFFLRWDNDANFSDGYESTVKWQSGGAIVPLGDLIATNFISVAGAVTSSGGGSNPPAPYPQGPRYYDGQGNLITGGQNWNGGGFFTGYWLTTGTPTINPGGQQPYGETSSLSNGIFVGGWYTKTTKFSMTSGTSGVYVGPPLTCNLSMSATQVNVSCHGGADGSIDVTVTGANGTVTYLWNDGATTQDRSGLTEGNYTVTATDNGFDDCSVSASFNITQPTEITVTPSHTDAHCNGGNDGSASVTASGGTPSYSYLWNTGATTQSISNLAAGTYTVTVSDSHGCTASASATVSQPSSAVDVSVSKTDVTITNGSDGTATANPTGGTPGYTFLWSTGATTQTITNLTVGTYTVTVTDTHGCTAVNQITLNQPGCNINMSQTHIDVACHGGTTGSIDITVTGAQGSVSYLWNDGATTQDRTGLSAGTYTVTATDQAGCAASASITIDEPASSVSVSLSKTDVTVTNGNDGTATANPSGGTPDYTFLWSTGATTQTITGLTAGTYTVTVSDSHGCTASGEITLDEPNCSISIDATHNDVSCYNGNNGSITVTISGAQGGVTYLWNDGATTQNRSGLSAGTYTVTATDEGGCTAVADGITVQQPSAPVSVSIAKTEVTHQGGHDGTATATASGGTPGYTYLWSTGATTTTITGLSAGTYTVTATDSHGCTGSNNITINEPNCPFFLSENHANVSCYGGHNGTITIGIHQYTGAVTYIWNDGATTKKRTNLYAGTYTVTATDGAGCVAYKTVVITQPSSPVSVSISKTDVTTHGGSDGTATATGSGGTPGYTYLWSNGGTTSTISNLTAGTYTVTATDSKGCSASNNITVNQPSNKEAASGLEGTSMKLYPNPAQDKFSIELTTNDNYEKEYTLVVENVLGQIIYSSQGQTLNGLVKEEISFDTPITDGIYSVQVIIAGNKEFNGQLVVQH